MPTLHIPSLLQDLTGNVGEVRVEVPDGERISVGQLLAELERRYPGVSERLTLEGEMMPGIAVFVDGEQSRLGLREKVDARAEIHFLPPVVGG